MYANDLAYMDAIVANLEGEAADWVTWLYNEEAPELGDPDAFLREFRACFKDNT